MKVRISNPIEIYLNPGHIKQDTLGFKSLSKNCFYSASKTSVYLSIFIDYHSIIKRVTIMPLQQIYPSGKVYEYVSDILKSCLSY